MNVPGTIMAPISTGELIDKITILEIKLERIQDQDKIGNIERELEVLKKARALARFSESELHALEVELKDVNTKLWEIEDAIRVCERNGDFGDDFLSLARRVYRTNDKRAALKKAINRMTGSVLVEEKSYEPY